MSRSHNRRNRKQRTAAKGSRDSKAKRQRAIGGVLINRLRELERWQMPDPARPRAGLPAFTEWRRVIAKARSLAVSAIPGIPRKTRRALRVKADAAEENLDTVEAAARLCQDAASLWRPADDFLSGPSKLKGARVDSFMLDEIQDMLPSAGVQPMVDTVFEQHVDRRTTVVGTPRRPGGDDGPWGKR